MVLKHNREFRIETLSNLLSNLSMFLGFALSLVFIIHILFFSSSYDVSIAQILQGFLGFTLLYLTFRGIYKRNIIFLISKQNFLKYIFTMPIIVILFIILYKLLLNDLDGYIRRMGEGSLVEWLSFLSLLLSSFLIFQTSKNNLNKKECILLKIFSLLLFIFSMEEISWGQMIFNWNSPKIIDSINIQSETNLHNIMFIHDKSWIILLCIFFTLFILSLLGFYYRRSRKIINGSTAEILFPLGCCSSYFGIASLIYIGVVLIKAGIDLPFMHTREQEMGELLFSIGVFIHSCHLYINLEKDNKIYQ